MIGAPPGYVGHDEAGQLTEAVRRRPYSGRALRRDREGAPGGAQRDAAAPRRRPAHRQQGADGGLQEHRRHHDVEPREPVHRRPSRVAGDRDSDIDESGAPAGDRGAPGSLPTGVPESRWTRSSSSTPSAGHASDVDHRDPARSTLQRRLDDRHARTSRSPTRAKSGCWSTRGYDAAVRRAPAEARRIQRQVLDPLAMRILQGEFGEGDRVEVDAGDGGLSFRKLDAAHAA